MNPLPAPDLLRPVAPPDLAPAVLFRVGLADEYLTVDSPVGPVFVARNGRGVSATAPAFEAGAADAFEATFGARFGRPIRPARRVGHDEVASLEAALREGRGRGVRFDLRATTPFGRTVLEAARRIPRGEIRPYGWIAREIGHPAAVRAVGSALGRNPVPLLIPCHRVVRSDGHIGDYAWGSAIKRAVLATEGVVPDDVEREARAGLHYVGSDTTHIVCWPTCHHVRSIQPRHRVPFTTMDAAGQAGYRPCRDCRP
ncbi:MAG TPA: methylated-DNA--[protein]-cysteine S-methyltransferase [Candidatus Baltobacteraceae bacterium]|nr:methylated-DNA--[protein]-cysteine S-methyltransferase [Candidatus Baltobacteraceae bacterium]